MSAVAIEPRAVSRAGRTERSDRYASLVRSAIALVAILMVWELIARTVLSGTRVLAPPTAIVRAAIEHAALYRRATITTVWEAARGFLWGNLAAVALAAVAALVPAVERIILRASLAVFCLPLVALGPLLRVTLGAGDGPQVVLAALAVFYTTLVPLLVGLRAVPASWTDLVASYGAGRGRTLWTVRSRAAVPYLFVGLQVAAPAAVLGALVGEFTGAERGLGLLVINSLRGLRTDELWAVTSIAALVAMAGYLLLGAVGRALSVEQPALLLAPRPPGSGPSWWRRVGRAGVELAVTVAILLIGWIGLMALFDLDPYFAKRPGDVWEHLVGGAGAAEHRRELFSALGATAVVAVPGYVAGLVAGAVLAGVFELSRALRSAITPFAVALRCVPIVAIAPLLVQAFGRERIGTTVTVAVLTFFPTLVACSAGLAQTPDAVRDLFRSYGSGRFRTLLRGQLPAMAPAFFAAARLAVPATVLAATVAEWLATGTGIGHLMAISAANSQYSTLWSSVVLVTALATAAYGLVAIVERIVLSRLAPEQVVRA